MGWNSLTPAQQKFVQSYLNIGPESASATTDAAPQNEAQPGNATPKSSRLPALQALEAGLDGLLAEIGPDGA